VAGNGGRGKIRGTEGRALQHEWFPIEAIEEKI